jgi:hypothetical protein
MYTFDYVSSVFSKVMSLFLKGSFRCQSQKSFFSFFFFFFALMSNIHSNNLPTKEQLFASLECKLQQSTVLNTVVSLMN